MSQHRYNDADIAAVYRAIYERRDMRHFNAEPLDPAVLQRLLNAAHHAPSVGFMQPWRFIRISDKTLRHAIHALVVEEREHTAEALGDREDEFRKLKVEGINHCSELIVVTLDPQHDQHIFGRRTLPSMDLASAACAIQNIWLAARAEGIGVGWVSIFDPDALSNLLKIPADSSPIAILCIGHVDSFYEKPMLETENWATRLPLSALLMENQWSDEA